MLEMNAVFEWFYTKLSSNSDITGYVGKHPTEGIWNIYEETAIQGTTYPLLLIRYISGANKIGGSGRRVFAKGIYQIHAVDDNSTSFAGVAGIADIIDRMFQQEQDNDDNTVIGITPLRPIKHVEFIGGKRRNHMGVELSVFAYNQSDN